jgi:hypothetical protein
MYFLLKKNLSKLNNFLSLKKYIKTEERERDDIKWPLGLANMVLAEWIRNLHKQKHLSISISTTAVACNNELPTKMKTNRQEHEFRKRAVVAFKKVDRSH